MDMIAKWRKEERELTKVCESLGKFNDQSVNPNTRSEIKDLLKELVNKGFKRVDKDQTVTLHMAGLPSELSEVVIIANNNGKFHVDTWRLWKMVYQITERIQEAQAYDGDY